MVDGIDGVDGSNTQEIPSGEGQVCCLGVGFIGDLTSTTSIEYGSLDTVYETHIQSAFGPSSACVNNISNYSKRNSRIPNRCDAFLDLYKSYSNDLLPTYVHIDELDIRRKKRKREKDNDRKDLTPIHEGILGPVIPSLRPISTSISKIKPHT